MCGIIGYIGNKKVSQVILTGLKNLEYRGYDSAGIATINDGKLNLVKVKGRIKDLESMLSTQPLFGNIGIGHTRWATHGKPSMANAHPHTDFSGRIGVVHNGIIENYLALKAQLEKKGIVFKSETDTEVIGHLIGYFYNNKARTLEDAVKKALHVLKGSYALGVISIDEPDKIIAARHDSPLIIGVGKDENFIVSDVSAILEHTKDIIYLNDGEFSVIRRSKINIFDIKGKLLKNKMQSVSFNRDCAQKGGFEHFMLKEISEQPKILSRILGQYVSRDKSINFVASHVDDNVLAKVQHLVIVACGTSYHAGLAVKYFIESVARIPVIVDFSSEFRYRNPIIADNSLVIAISQSGETADTLAAVRQAKKQNNKVLAVCNVVGSTLTREADYILYTQAGPEISVASTKAYTAQVMVLYLLGLYLAEIKKVINRSYLQKAITSLQSIPGKQRQIVDMAKMIRKVAEKNLHFGAFLYLGRNNNYPTAMEGALKLKEISYIPTEGYPSGEMKHGPIALIDEYRAVVCIVNDSFILDKMVSNIEEISARQGKIIAVATKGNKEVKDHVNEIIYIPEIAEEFSPLLTIVPLQLFAYYMAVLKGYDVDKPRNLAKSVTVE